MVGRIGEVGTLLVGLCSCVPELAVGAGLDGTVPATPEYDARWRVADDRGFDGGVIGQERREACSDRSCAADRLSSSRHPLEARSDPRGM